MTKYFLLGLCSSTALYGVLSLLACVFLFDVDLGTITAPAGQDGVAGLFSSYMTLCVPAYPILMGLHVLMVEVGRRFDRRFRDHYYPRNFTSVLARVPSWVGADLTNPFRGLRSIIGARRTIDSEGLLWVSDWVSVILHLVWSLGLVAWIALGLVSVTR
jgi:hypothetical protein